MFVFPTLRPKLANMKRYFFTSLVLVLFFITTTMAQIPTDVPHPDNNSPIDLTKTADILIYIVMPVLILLLLALRLRKGKK